MIEPLERGFGITLGNALRRVLLSSIPGAAVTYVKIDGVLHEFSTISGVVEDTVDLLLNLKGLPLKLNTDDPKVLTLNARAARRKSPPATSRPTPTSRSSNPNYHIATISKKDSKLSMEIGIEKSRGYVTERQAAQHRAHDRAHSDGLDLLADPQSQFHRRRHARRPVGRLRPSHARDRDQRFDHARRRALGSRATSSPISSRSSSTSRPKRSPSPTAPASEWDVPVETLNLSVRSFNCLKRAGISKVSELLDMTEDEIIKMRNFGKKSLDEIKQVLEERGLSLRQS